MFTLKCGMHWLSITKLYGGRVVVCSDPKSATKFQTGTEARQMAESLGSEEVAKYGRASLYDVVEVDARGCEVHGR